MKRCRGLHMAHSFNIGWRRTRRRQSDVPERRLSYHDSGRGNTLEHTRTEEQELDQGGSTSRSARRSTSPVSSRHSPASLHASNSNGLRSLTSIHAAESNGLDSRASVTFPPEGVTSSLAMAESSLFRFFKEGLSASARDWTMFDKLDSVRTAYVGTQISNMTHLIRLESRSRPSFIIYAYPQIHPPTNAKSGLHDYGEGTGSRNGDKLRSINSFPSQDIRDDLVEAFFGKIHPYFPVVDEADFRAKYAQDGNAVPILLLHSVLLVGAHASSHPKVQQSRHVVKAILFSRAKKVFDLRHEHDRMHLVQAALLFSWHLQDGDNAAANSFYWIGVACRIAFGLGMHRNSLSDPLEPNRMPITDRRIWRRIWWTLFQTEALSALEHGRPPMIRAEDYDQPPLSLEDFTEANGVINCKVDFQYCVRNIELCEVAFRIMRLNAPRAMIQPSSQGDTVSSLQSRLISWSLEESCPTPFGSLYLRLHYDTIVLHLFRTNTDQPFSPTSIDSSASFEGSQISNSAAKSIASTLEYIHSNRHMAQCSFTAIIALTAAAIQASRDTQRAIDSGNTMLALSEHHLLHRVCAVAKHLSEFWPSAEGIRKVFQSLSDDFSTLMREHRKTWEGPNGAEDIDGAIAGGMSINWPDVLAMPAFDGINLDAMGWENSVFDMDHGLP